MMDFEQSNYEISLQRPYYMSELMVPTTSTLTIGKNISAEVNGGARESSATSCSVRTESIASLKSTVDGSGENALLMQIQPSGKLVDCPYKAAGCTGAYITSSYLPTIFFI